MIWSPGTVRAILARSGKSKQWLHERLVEQGASMSLSTIYNWLRLDPLGRPDDATVAMIRGITDDLKENTK